MLSFECKLEVHNVLVIQIHHYVPFVCHHALLATVQQTLFLHQLERIVLAILPQPRQEHSREAPRPDALHDVKVFEGDAVHSGVSPDGLNF